MKKVTILLCLVSILSCKQSEPALDKIAQKPEIIETVDLENEIGQPPFDNASFVPYYLDDNKLLIYATDPVAISTIFNYDLVERSTKKWDQDIYSDLRYSSKVNSGNELFIFSRDEEFFSIDIDNLTTVENESIATISNNFIKLGNLLYFKNLDNGQLNLIEYNIANKTSDLVYILNSNNGSQYDSNLQFDIHVTSDSEIILFAINQIDDTYYLEQFNITTKELISTIELDEFDGSSNRSPSFVKYTDNKIVVFGDEFISCRDSKSGQLIWSESKGNSIDFTPSVIYQDKIINVTADKVESYNLETGILNWELDKFGVDGQGAGWQNFVNLSNVGGYLFLNHYPINIETGELLWSEAPKLDWGNLDYFYAQPAIDIDNEFVYFITNHTLYKLKLPQIK